MVNFEIPDSFKEAFEGNFTLDSLVKSCIGEFGEWLQENNVRFFAEYTDHSLRHVENVLRMANQLIREECSGLLTAQDIATLIIAIFLHDSAMHLSIDGFLDLISNDQKDRVINGFGDRPWKVLWLEYLAEARRFSGRKLIALFGDTKPVEYPPANPQDMTGRDLLLIGEFLRRHHHRLAHEIARFGVPGPRKEKLNLKTNPETEQIVDLAGLIARSHGMAIRDCYSYLENTYGSLKSITQVHPIYLMTLLRVADIIQIDSNRAPRYVEKLRDIQSPVSQAEWELHYSIKDINFEEYAETVLITTRPENVKTYIKIRNLLDQMQKELDSSWTAIGEIYGYDRKFREFGLTIRRVRSNIDDVEKFQKQVDYIPCQASFEVADTDLLKLLIAPLYGDDPAIGIRELVQNSIDAVRELRAYQQNRPEFQIIELTTQDGDIVVSIDKDIQEKWWLTVSDRGIGMRLQTVIDYFLKAGASLRKSDLWRKTFEDEKGNSIVLRSGRFGVGALAAFLLGDEIIVSTRYVEETSENGILFSAHIDSEVIELHRTKRPIGTTVRICITEAMKDKLTKDKENSEVNPSEEVDLENEYYELFYGPRQKAADSWDWYCLLDPKVSRIFQGQVLEQNYTLPNSKAGLSHSQRRISHPDYEDVQWHYDQKMPDLVCNGILVKSNKTSSRLPRLSGRSFLRMPNLSIFDPNANLPLNLERTAITQASYPFQDELIGDIFRDFIAYVLLNAPPRLPGDKADTKPYISLNYPGYSNDYSSAELNFSPWYTFNQDVGLFKDIWNLRQTMGRSVLCLSGYLESKGVFSKKPDYQSVLPKFRFPKDQMVVSFFVGNAFRFSLSDDTNTLSNINTALTNIVMMGPRLPELMSKIRGLPYKFLLLGTENKTDFIHEKRILFSRSKYGKLLKILNDPDYGTSDYLKFENFVDLKIEWQNDNWLLWKIGDCPDPVFDFVRFAEEITPNDNWPCLLSEFYFAEKISDENIPAFSKVWTEIVKSPTIPLDLGLRREKLSEAFQLLAPYIEAHEYLKQEAEKSIQD